MTYRQKFDDSQQRAHHQNIATKILRDMSDLRGKAEESKTAPRRWIWELIQNAKDVHQAGVVDILVELKENHEIVFKHNGKPFSADNIRFLIEQISTKDRNKDEDGNRKTTGKFGTGFLTTHLLSEFVTIQGVAKEDGLSPKKFVLRLDRSGYELDEITDAVEKAKASVYNLDDLETYHDYEPNNLNTVFKYPLNDDLSLRIAKDGLEDLKKCLPYALLFVPEIKTLHIAHLNDLYYMADDNPFEEIEFITINIENQDFLDDPEEHIFVKLTSGHTSIAIPVEVVENQVKILPINHTIPRLFCDFPLIGTEYFSFPAIINNPDFNPTDPRDGVYLTGSQHKPNRLSDENKEIVQVAIRLYYQLLDHAIANEWENLHLLANITPLKDPPYWVNSQWFNDEVLKPIRNKILHAKIVRTAKGELASILTPEKKSFMWFPTAFRKEIREKIWELSSDWFPHCLPAKSDVELWYKLAWDECGKLTLQQFSAFVEQKKSLSELNKVLITKDPIEWLNDFYMLLGMDEKEYHTIMDKREIVPDQNGNFSKRSQLHEDSGDITGDFKIILEEFDNEIRSELADENIELNFDERLIDEAYVVKEITAEVTSKTVDRDIAQKYRTALNHLLIYFRNHPDKSKKLFPTIFKNKHLLYDDDEILENISKAEQLDDLLKEFDATTTEDLRAILSRQPSQNNELLPITQELLVDMGISNIEEWKEALEDKDLKALFAHNSVPTTDMFVIAQSLIIKAKNRVIKHLETLDDYDLSEMDDQTATTILAGLYKNQQPLSVVFRPAYNGEVIIYYGSERETLAYEPSELWIDDGDNVRQITIGHILKSAEIRKFPI